MVPLVRVAVMAVAVAFFLFGRLLDSCGLGGVSLQPMRALIVSVRGGFDRELCDQARDWWPTAIRRHRLAVPRRDRAQCHAPSRLEHVVISQQTALATMRDVVALWYVGHRTAADVVYSACDLLVARPEHR